MADVVAIVSIAASATVAIAVPVISGHLERRRLRWEREHQALDELRAALDDAGVALTTALFALDEARASTQPQSSLPAPAVDGEHRRLAEALDRVWQHETRLAIRLGTRQDAYVAYLQAAQVIHAGLFPKSGAASAPLAAPGNLDHAYLVALSAQDRFFNSARTLINRA